MLDITSPPPPWLCVQVRSLEAANRKLELQIREYIEKRTPGVGRDLTKYYATISDIRAQVNRWHASGRTTGRCICGSKKS